MLDTGSPSTGPALDGGEDSTTATAWIIEAATDQRSAQAELAHLATQAPAPLTADEALAVVDRLGGTAGLLEHADQSDRGDLYAALGVSATYDPTTRSAELTVAIPRGAKTCRRGTCRLAPLDLVDADGGADALSRRGGAMARSGPSVR